MNYKYISMIHKQFTTYFKVKYGSNLIGYYKSHGVGMLIYIARVEILSLSMDYRYHM